MIHRSSDAYNSTEVPIALGLTWIDALKTVPSGTETPDLGLPESRTHERFDRVATHI